MLRSFIFALPIIFALISSCSAGLVTPRAASPFDGQYIDVNFQNNATEWWWVQVGAPAKDGESPPSFHATFYQGYPISVLREASGGNSAPENYIVINGAFPNSTVFAYNLVASASSVTYSGNAVHGSWPGAGSFDNSADLSTFTVTLHSPSVKGTITINSNAPHHYGCNTTTDPANEDEFYTKLGWATSQPGGAASVSVVLDGTPFEFDGQGYHDANWMTQPIDAFMDNWYFVNAQVGPYDLSAVWSHITGSTREFTTGFLQADGVILQNQCSVEGAKADDFSKLTQWGLKFDEPSGVNVFDGLILEYTLANGDLYRFNLTGQSLVLDQPIYHRWVGSAVGGKVGGEQYEGITMYDWLNPSLTPYNG
ncbi:hypothetical protein BD310DRAFT_1028299 [Dichomitus squalens]|uniref:Hydroxyneurosporene synthase n=1 Tax=Dichomitus squalens TaxID=114155 RepID=A0A4Q9PN53_9APHY|nr:hypothetical protein BD310DRAFT_1028299 [Dichomitus squalens]